MSKKRLRAETLAIVAAIQADISKWKLLLTIEKDESKRQKYKTDIARAIWRMHQAQAELAKINAIKGPLSPEITNI